MITEFQKQTYGSKFSPTESEARQLNVETGESLWHCRQWDLWWCSPEASLPRWPVPGAVHCDWVEISVV